MRHVRFLLSAACALTLTVMPHGLVAQEDSAAPDDPAPAVTWPPATSQAEQEALAEQSQAWMEGEYLGALRAFERVDPADRSAMMLSIYEQFLPSLDGFVAGQRAVLLNLEGGEIVRDLEPLGDEERSILEGANLRNAIEEIAERAQHTRIVIVNETHDNPRDRAFIADVAETLAPLGYTHYAAETFDNWGTPETVAERMETMFQRGYAAREDGFYSKGPGFAHALLRIFDAGFRPVSYEWTPRLEDRPENPSDTIALREAAQAENLAAAIAAAGPDARFLIHVGYSHAAELPFPNGQSWMAAQLKELTGIDPLTINQTDLSEYNMPAAYAALAPRIGNIPMVLFEGKEPMHFGLNASLMDLQVVHPPIKAFGGRPDWLARTGRRAVPVPDELMPMHGRALVQVFLDDAGANAVPIDQVLVQAGDEVPLLYVPKDRGYRLAVQHD